MTQKQVAIVVALIRNEKGEILLAKRHEPEKPEIHNKWELLGGGIEHGETAEDAIIREVKEESGLEVKIARLLPKIITSWQKFKNGTDLQVIIITYECKITGGNLTLDDKEISEFKYVKPEDINNYDCLDNVDTIIAML
jgi:mutator protein MutT